MGLFFSLRRIFGGVGELTPEYWDGLLERFILADMGFETAQTMVGRLKRRAGKAGAKEPSALLPLFAEELGEVFASLKKPDAETRPEVVLMMGVNGVGKTTTIAKLARRGIADGRKVMLAAGDTFRAAAVEQLRLWAERVGADFHGKGQNADPAAVAWEACDRAQREGVDLLFVDTAGRLHTQINLMDELRKVRSVIARKIPGAPHRNVLVIDATTGQNALTQVRQFKEAVGVDEIILTKTDGTSKGGVLIAVALQYGLPISFVGRGEGADDLIPFDGAWFAAKLLEDGDE